eukprot:3451682-Amphidinium_carterae.1
MLYQVWGEEAGLAKVAAEHTKTRESVEALSEEMKLLQEDSLLLVTATLLYKESVGSPKPLKECALFGCTTCIATTIGKARAVMEQLKTVQDEARNSLAAHISRPPQSGVLY